MVCLYNILNTIKSKKLVPSRFPTKFSMLYHTLCCGKLCVSSFFRFKLKLYPCSRHLSSDSSSSWGKSCKASNPNRQQNNRSPLQSLTNRRCPYTWGYKATTTSNSLMWWKFSKNPNRYQCLTRLALTPRRCLWVPQHCRPQKAMPSSSCLIYLLSSPTAWRGR